MSAEAEEAGSTVLWRAGVGKILAAPKNDVRDRGQALDIINDSWATPESDDGWEWRTDTGNAALAFQRFHQRRFFADFVGAGAGVPVAIELFAGAQYVVAEESLSVRIV